MSDRHIERYLTKMLTNLGLSDAEAIIYSVLVLSDVPLSIEGLKRISKYSVPRIYSALSFLINNGLVDRRKGDHMYLYSANLNFIELFDKKRKRLYEEHITPMLQILSTTRDFEKNRESIKNIREYAYMIKEYLEGLAKASEELKKKLREKYPKIPRSI